MITKACLGFKITTSERGHELPELTLVCHAGETGKVEATEYLITFLHRPF
jgi:hypothetical protein